MAGSQWKILYHYYLLKGTRIHVYCVEYVEATTEYLVPVVNKECSRFVASGDFNYAKRQFNFD